jgi:alkylation response protein AidB-like acyl-CoA dehydrogenase
VAHARANVPAHGPQTQLDRHLKPRSAAELHDAYAVTDGHAASDPARITATRTGDGGWRIDGEKWFVTYGDSSRSTSSWPRRSSTAASCRRCSSSSAGRRASRSSTTRPSPTATPTAIPTLRFTGVEVREEAIVGGLGGGEDLQRGWSAEERQWASPTAGPGHVAADRGGQGLGASG